MNTATPIAWLLICGGFLLPFSLAVSNILFGIALALGVATGLWWKQIRSLWNQERMLTALLAGYVALMAAGISWSLNPSWGVHFLAKQWSWALLPLLFLLGKNDIWRQKLLVAVSLGLALHLVIPFLQAAGHPLPLDYPAGSSIEDPTGLIGHIGFGLVYAVWAGWLIHRGYLLKGRERILCWFLAAISFGMIFLAQGRSGYLVAVAVLLAASWKIWLHRTSRQTVAAVVLASLAISSIALLGPARERLSSTVSSIHSVIQGDIAHAEERVSLWYLAWKGIRSHPWFGLGTGGYSTYAKKQADSDPRIHLNIAPGHPHQIYLAAWTRWGPVGLLLVLALFWTWIRRGSQASWHANDASLVLLSGLALAVHGLSAPSLDEYFASIYAVLWLGLGLGAMHQEEVQ